uniref:Uncharacterized protein n=1 Tax=Oryza sativa subsp. japonica TaxID=39947 RepID=Q6K2Y1_ORYSJ|nr:hypothetical protein [Oryza sativa Japonica Group]
MWAPARRCGESGGWIGGAARCDDGGGAAGWDDGGGRGAGGGGAGLGFCRRRRVTDLGWEAERGAAARQGDDARASGGEVRRRGVIGVGGGEEESPVGIGVEALVSAAWTATVKHREGRDAGGRDGE